MKIIKYMLAISAMYLLCVSQIIFNTNFALLHWMCRKRARNRLSNQLLYNKVKLDDTIRHRLIRKPRRKNKIRSYDFWKRIVQNEFKEEDWLENFRVTQDTFEFIVDKLKEEIKPRENMLNEVRTITDVKKKVAVALYYLASCGEYRIVGNTFGIHKATVHNKVYEFVIAVNKVLLPEYIQMCSVATALENAAIFENSTKLPNIIGAIDGTHIPILPPKDGHRDFMNRKGWKSIILQAVVNPKYRFMDICIKNPGATHDAAVLAGSDLYRNIDKILPKLLCAQSYTISLLYEECGQRIAPITGGHPEKCRKQFLYFSSFVIWSLSHHQGDPAYPLLPWLMKPYSSRGLTPEQDSYNVYTSSGRVVVEIAFGRLKARWRRLLNRCDINYKFVPNIVAACCALHNIIENRKERFIPRWADEVEKAELIFPQPPKKVCRINDTREASSLRNILCDYLARNIPLRISRQI